VDRGNVPGCGVETTISLEIESEIGDDEPAVGVLVEVLGSDPLESGISDENGQVVLTLPVAEPALLYVHPTANAWGRVETVEVDPLDPALGFGVMEDALFATSVDAAGVAAPDTARGVLNVAFMNVPGSGGETAAIAPSCATATCGPVVLEDWVSPVLSDELVPNSDQFFYLSLVAGDYALAPDGVDGVDTCTLEGSNPWPVFAHTITRVRVACSIE
jgi:hypothetical protein